MTSAWRKATEAQFPDREVLSIEDLRRRFWAELPMQDVCEVFDTLDYGLGSDFSLGLLRPGDPLSLLFNPPATRNPWRSLIFHGHAADSDLYVAARLAKRLRKLGTQAEWNDHIKTVDDLVRAWCGASRDDRRSTMR
jgi:hypothetical protein